MIEPFAIRVADFADIPALVALYHVLGGRPAGYAEQCMAEQQAERRLALILSDGPNDIGMAMLNWTPLYAPYRRLGIPEIQDLAVAPGSRGQGAGTALIAHCEGLARGKDCAEMGISVGLTADFGAAQRLYVRLGYVPDGGGVTYDRQPVMAGTLRPVDENLCLMLVKTL